eukprot:gnl/TRDRNA2_/TRDRNA2_177327_c4_seq3.p1 gnl/TRDRNA2_/TRDRNA2_177327_c4~~gnl/TRDRNA2_/TRDRNA2_177327_c4_seq3.p1  ORF type:complete len:206 (+),score=68.27 gnl/TRDRNA2_/TRDRNA2_177327_c4_seq3:60-677(+)
MASLARVVLVLALASLAGASGDQDGSVNGVQKVIQMLQDMLAKAKTEKHDEEVAFAKFSVWCKEGADDLAAQIVKEGEEIELLRLLQCGSLAAAVLLEEGPGGPFIQLRTPSHAKAAGQESDLPARGRSSSSSSSFSCAEEVSKALKRAKRECKLKRRAKKEKKAKKKAKKKAEKEKSKRRREGSRDGTEKEARRSHRSSETEID